VIRITSPPSARRAFVLLCALSLAACGGEPSAESPTTTASEGGTGTTARVTARVGTEVRFIITHDNGDPVSWSVLTAADARPGAATIDASGGFRAVDAGHFLVIATRGAERAFAHVVASGDAPLASSSGPIALSFAGPRASRSDGRMSLSLSEFWIESSPDTVRLSTGASVRLKVVGRSADGATWSIRPDWQASGGTVSDSGLYTAPAVDGRYVVVVTRDGDIQTDTSVVVVGAGLGDSSAVPVPAPSDGNPAGMPVPSVPATTTACTNEPAGYRRIIDAP
jgi:hypothetical protein